jgi:hypothetical protein
MMSLRKEINSVGTYSNALKENEDVDEEGQGKLRVRSFHAHEL